MMRKSHNNRSDRHRTSTEFGTSSLPTTTYHGRYPPLYYALVGWPTYSHSVKAAVFGARLLTALASAVLLAGVFNIAASSRRRRLFLPAVLMVATPEVMLVGASVSPSALEISAAICAWTAALVWLFDVAGTASAGRTLHWLGASACVLVLARPLGPLWLAFLAAAMLLLGGRSSFSPRLGDRAVRAWLVAVGLSVTAALTWLAVARPLDSRTLLHTVPIFGRGTPFGTILLAAFGHGPQLIDEMIGAIGWNDTLLPTLVYRT